MTRKISQLPPNATPDETDEVETSNGVLSSRTPISAIRGKNPIIVIKQVDETINDDTVLHDDDELFFEVEANTIYYLQFTYYFVGINLA